VGNRLNVSFGGRLKLSLSEQNGTFMTCDDCTNDCMLSPGQVKIAQAEGRLCDAAPNILPQQIPRYLCKGLMLKITYAWAFS
jgi:hypothetical protein